MALGSSLSSFGVSILFELLLTEGFSALLTASFDRTDLQPITTYDTIWFQYRAWLHHWPRINYVEPIPQARPMNVILVMKFHYKLSDPEAEGDVIGSLPGDHEFHLIAEKYGNRNYWRDTFPVFAASKNHSVFPAVVDSWDTIAIGQERIGNIFTMDIRAPLTIRPVP